jgi:hypothetical protein
VPGLLDPRLAIRPGHPEALLDHPPAERLDREPKAFSSVSFS